MTDRELMQQALDAMLNFPNDISDEMFESIRVLRERLAQPEQEIDPDRDHVEDDGCPTEKAVLQRFWREHQKQEPVACPYCHYSHTLGAVFFDQNCAGCVNRMTTPPQREWQGLTDEEQMQVAWSCGAMSADWLDFARAIEAKLKAKNAL